MHVLFPLPFLLFSLQLTLEEEEEKKKMTKLHVLPSSLFATLALILGDIDILVGQGSPWKQPLGA